MSTCLPRGTLTISIDLEYDMARVGLAEQRSLERMTDRLLDLVARHEMPVTWGVADPAVSAATTRIINMQAGHELAILGDASWVGRDAGRSRFGRELSRRAVRAQGEGIPVRTLVLRSALPADHCDLAIKEGIVAVRHQPEADASRGPRRNQPQTLRFSLWSFPAAITLPGTSRWFPGGGGLRAARFAIDLAVSDCGLVQLAIDAPGLVARGLSAERIVERVLDHAARRRRHGLLDVVTLGAMARRLSRENQGSPSHSILRPAA